MKHDFIDIMHDRLSQHEMIEPSGLWQDINDSLDARVAKKKGVIANRSAIYKAVAGIAAAALVAVVMWVALQGESDSTAPSQNIAQNGPLPNKSDDSVEPMTPPSQEQQVEPPHTSNLGGTERKVSTHQKKQVVNANNGTVETIYHKDDVLPHAVDEQNKDNRQDVTVEPDNMTERAMIDADTVNIIVHPVESPIDTPVIILQEPAPQLTQLWAVTEKPRENQLPLEMSLSYNGFLASAGLTSSGNLDYFVLANENSSPDPLIPQDEEPVMLAEKEELGMPIKVGLAVWYPVGEKWRVGSGLVYTHLTRKVTTIYTRAKIRSNEKADYLGIPIEVSRILWSKNRWALYANAGAMVEFNLKSSMRKESELALLFDKDYHDKRPQFSAIAGLGLQYNVADRVGLYLEPGASYYFNNGADDNIYMSRPLRFDVNLGLRIIFGKKR